MSRPALPGAPIPAPKPTTWLAARLRAPWLDRDLAAGVAPWRSRAHAARALQLTGDRHRRAMARSLERLIEVADRPTFMSAAIPPRPEQVHDASPLILAIAATLRDGTPVDASGVARLSQLLSDGGGPCYARARPGALRAALETVSQWLEVLD